jgi:alanine racemase
MQFERFQLVLNALQKVGIHPGLRHCCASTTVFDDDDLLLDGVRIGSALLGRGGGAASSRGLMRTGICQVSIEAVRSLPKGAIAGYGGVYKARKDMQIAVCAIGTHHGVGVLPQAGLQQPVKEFLSCLRLIRNRITGRSVLTAMIGGKRCKMIGTVYSEMVMLDVTDVPCKAGDTALFDINPILLHDVPIQFI